MMSRRSMSSSIIYRCLVVVVAAVLAACSGSPGQTATPGTSKAPSASAVVGASPSAPPSPSETRPSGAPASPTGDLERLVEYESNRFPYAISVPASWATKEVSERDFYGAKAKENLIRQVDVHFYPAITDEPAAWFEKVVTALESYGPIESTRSITVAGHNARLYELHAASDDVNVLLLRTSFIDQPNAWEISWVSGAGGEVHDRAQFDAILATFRPSTTPRNVWALEPGQCFRSSLPIGGTQGLKISFMGPVDGFEAVDCAQAHSGEVVARLDPTDNGCTTAFEQYTGEPAATSRWAVVQFLPIPSDILPAGVVSLCVATDPSGDSTGSARDSGR